MGSTPIPFRHTVDEPAQEETCGGLRHPDAPPGPRPPRRGPPRGRAFPPGNKQPHTQQNNQPPPAPPAPPPRGPPRPAGALFPRRNESPPSTRNATSPGNQKTNW